MQTGKNCPTCRYFNKNNCLLSKVEEALGENLSEHCLHPRNSSRLDKEYTMTQEEDSYRKKP